MKTLFTKKTIIISGAAILIAVTTLVSVNVFGNSGAVTKVANAFTKPLKSITSSIARSFESIYGSIYKYEALKEDYEKALEDIAELRRAYREYTDLSEENERLYALLNFRDRHSDHVYAPAVIVSWSDSNWSSTFTISRGSSNSDVAVGDSVVTEHGMLLGRVTVVGDTASTVSSVLDTTFSAAAHIGESGGAATAKGDFTMMGKGMLKLDHIIDESLIVPGDTVVTSGKGGVFPAGLILGEVSELFAHSTGIGYYASVRPIVKPEEITSVYIITDFEITD